MIATLEGRLAECGPLNAVIEAGGVGYEVFVPITTAERLPPPGQTARLFTHAVYREDAATLYGFLDREDRDLFRLLLDKVSGIGPRIALNMLSRLPADNLKQSIASGDVKTLSACPGIGKKTAERLVIELRDKVFPAGARTPSATGTGAVAGATFGSSLLQDGVAALVVLGYKAAEADKAVRRVIQAEGEKMTVETLIRKALQKDGS